MATVHVARGSARLAIRITAGEVRPLVSAGVRFLTAGPPVAVCRGRLILAGGVTVMPAVAGGVRREFNR